MNLLVGWLTQLGSLPLRDLAHVISYSAARAEARDNRDII